MPNTYPPGTLTPRSGQYTEVGPRGERVDYTEITCVEGKPFPATSRPEHTWMLVDATRHKQ